MLARRSKNINIVLRLLFKENILKPCSLVRAGKHLKNIS